MNRCVIVGGADIENYEAVKKYLREDDFYVFCDSGQKHISSLGISPDLIVGDFDSWKPQNTAGMKIGLLNQELNFRQVQADISGADDLLLWNGAGEITGETMFQNPDNLSVRNKRVTSKDKTESQNTDNLSALSRTEKEPEILVIPHEKYDTDTMYGVREGISRGYKNFLLIGVIGQRMYHTLGNLYILVMLDSMHLKGMIVDDYSDMEMVSEAPAYITAEFQSFSLLNVTGTARKIKIEDAKYCYLPGDEITCEYQYAVSNEVIPGKTAKVTVGEGRLLLIRDRLS